MGDGRGRGVPDLAGPSCACRLITQPAGLPGRVTQHSLLIQVTRQPPPRSGLGRCLGWAAGASLPCPGSAGYHPGMAHPHWLHAVFPSFGVFWEALVCFRKEFVI